jgi:hypothetical protein
MALEIVTRPELLAYRNTVTLGGVILTIDLAYHIRTDDWWIGFYDEEGLPIVEGRRLVTGWPLNISALDERMPQGIFLAVRQGEGEADARIGELGRAVRLLFLDADELTSLEPATDPLAPRAIISIGGV